MDNVSVRSMILSTPLREEPVIVTGWEQASLIIRELDGKAGSTLIQSCMVDGEINQDSLVAGVVMATLRNADDPNKALVFAKADNPNEYDPTYKDSLLATGLGRIMQVANASIALSGLNAAAAKDAKNA